MVDKFVVMDRMTKGETCEFGTKHVSINSKYPVTSMRAPVCFEVSIIVLVKRACEFFLCDLGKAREGCKDVL
eukprot:127406-Pelagomonas_calceolata.AAC.1